MSRGPIARWVVAWSAAVVLAMGVGCPSIALAAPPAPLSVNLYNLGLSSPDLSNGVNPWPMWSSPGGAVAVSSDGTKIYWTTSSSSDEAQRNLVVGTLNSAGVVVGLPAVYPTSNQALGLARTGAPNGASLPAISINAAKKRLYLGEYRGSNQTSPTNMLLHVFTLDSAGNPSGAVRDYNASLYGEYGVVAVGYHPTQPVLYLAGGPFTTTGFNQVWGLVTYALDSNGEPTGSPNVIDLNASSPNPSIGFTTCLALNSSGTELYLGNNVDQVAVVDLASTGLPVNTTGTVRVYTMSNTQVGTNNSYNAAFSLGSKALYIVRPPLSGSPAGPLGFLATWKLDSNGNPVAGATPNYSINPPVYQNGWVVLHTPIAVDTTNSNLWVANPTTFTDAISSAQLSDGITPTAYAINTDGSLGSATSFASQSSTGYAAVEVPGGAGGVARFFTYPFVGGDAVGNRVSGYQVRITIHSSGTSPTGIFPMEIQGCLGPPSTYAPNVTFLHGGVASLPLDTPSDWYSNLTGYLDVGSNPSAFPVPLVVLTSNAVNTLSVTLDLANSSGTILKTVTETLSAGYNAGFLLPSYGMPLSALTTNSNPSLNVWGLETFSQRSQDYLNAANRDAVTSANQPKGIITNCLGIGGGGSEGLNFYGSGNANYYALGEGSTTLLNNMAMAMHTIGINTAGAGDYGALPRSTINNTMTSNGIIHDETAWSLQPAIFSFDTTNVGASALVAWSSNGIGSEALANGAPPSQIICEQLWDEIGWNYPVDYYEGVNGLGGLIGDVNMVGTNVGNPWISSFWAYLTTNGFTPSTFGQGSWSQVYPIGQSYDSFPATSLQQRQLYYWSMRWYADSATAGLKAAAQAFQAATTNPRMYNTVNHNNWINLWYLPEVDGNPPDTAIGSEDWYTPGRTNAHTIMTEDGGTVPDWNANLWSYYSAVVRSSAMLGTNTTNQVANVDGYVMGGFQSAAKYKAFSALGNGAKHIRWYTFGPAFAFGDGFSDTIFSTNNNWGPSSPYSEIADADRLIGQAEAVGTNDVFANGLPEHSKVLIIDPNSSSSLWQDQATDCYYQFEAQGLQYALSHGYSTPVDFCEDQDVAAGILNTNSYWLVYALGPNLSAGAQTALSNWITTHGTHSRALVLMQGAGTADEYNTATTNLDGLAGLTAGSRVGDRSITPGANDSDLYTATMQNANTNNDFYYFISSTNNTMGVRGPIQYLSPLIGSSGPSWTDEVFVTTTNPPACVTKLYTATGQSTNYVTTYGYYPGYQYLTSWVNNYAAGAPTGFLPQGWSVMAREAAIMPGVRMANYTTNSMYRTFELYNLPMVGGGLTNNSNNYLTTTPVEALRLNMGNPLSPNHAAVVLLNWSGSPLSNVKFKLNNGWYPTAPDCTQASSGTSITLSSTNSTGVNADFGTVTTLNDVDVLIFKK